MHDDCKRRKTNMRCRQCRQQIFGILDCKRVNIHATMRDTANCPICQCRLNTHNELGRMITVPPSNGCQLLNLGNIFVFDVKVIYHLWVYLDSSVVFSPSRIHCLWGNPLAASLNSFVVLFPSIYGFLLAVGYLVSNCDLRCFVAAGIAA